MNEKQLAKNLEVYNDSEDESDENYDNENSKTQNKNDLEESIQASYLQREINLGETVQTLKGNPIPQDQVENDEP